MALSILDSHIDKIEDWIKADYTNTEIVGALRRTCDVQTSEASVRRVIGRWLPLAEADEGRQYRSALEAREKAPGVTVEDDQVVLTLPANTPIEELTTAEILDRHNLDPEEWEVKNSKVNTWYANAGRDPETGVPTRITLYQFTVRLGRKIPFRMVFPPTEPSFQYVKPARLEKTEAQFGIIVTDHQAPHINKELHALTCEFIRKNRPDFAIAGGDGIDNSVISRHRDDPAWDVPVQVGVDSFFDVLYDYRDACEATDWTIIPGNHDDRIRNEMLERAKPLHGLRQAQWPGEEPEEWVYSLRHLLNLDRLGMNYAFSDGAYEFQQVNITSLLAVRHGHRVVKDGALKTAVALGHSVVLGHTHRQSVARKTIWNSITQRYDPITAIEAGCMCQIEGGIGFASAGSPDWQPGFATVTTFPDGHFTWDHATYEQEGKLRWRDQVFSL